MSAFLICNICCTALAKSTGLPLATAPTCSLEFSNKNSPTALVLEATTGVPDAIDSRAARQKVSIGPGAIYIA